MGLGEGDGEGPGAGVGVGRAAVPAEPLQAINANAAARAAARALAGVPDDVVARGETAHRRVPARHEQR